MNLRGSNILDLKFLLMNWCQYTGQELDLYEQTLDEYLSIGIRLPESSPCIGDEGGKGTLCVTCHVCFGGTGCKDDGGCRGITFESYEDLCDVFFTNYWMLLEMSFLAMD